MTKSVRSLVTLTLVAVCIIAGFLAIEFRTTVFKWYLAEFRGHGAPTIIRRPGAFVRAASTENAGIRNIAPFATVSVSSVEESDGTLAQGVADGVADSKDWVTEGETAGAWIRLDWNAPATIFGVDLYDLPNPVDNVLSGTLTFDDGSVLPVESLPPGGAPRRIAFPARTVRSVVFRIDRAQGSNAGLAEIMVFGTLN
jgi:hypothetical protein